MDIYNEIKLDFTPDNFRTVLEWGASPSNAPHSHQAIAGWCERFWNKYSDIDASPEIETVLPMLGEVEVEWDCYVAAQKDKHINGPSNGFSLPTEWFAEWLSQLNT